VEPERGETGSGHGRGPHPLAEVLQAEEAALRDREHEALCAGLGIGRQVLLERGDHNARQGHRPPAGRALGYRDHVAAGDVLHLLDGTIMEIDEMTEVLIADLLSRESRMAVTVQLALGPSTVKDLVAGSKIDFVERGTHELKGVPGEWHLYAVGA
jgi:hypothetical protein